MMKLTLSHFEEAQIPDRVHSTDLLWLLNHQVFCGCLKPRRLLASQRNRNALRILWGYFGPNPRASCANTRPSACAIVQLAKIEKSQSEDMFYWPNSKNWQRPFKCSVWCKWLHNLHLVEVMPCKAVQVQYCPGDSPLHKAFQLAKPRTVAVITWEFLQVWEDAANLTWLNTSQRLLCLAITLMIQDN